MDNSKCMWIEVLTANVRVNVYPMKETTVPTASSPCVGKTQRVRTKKYKVQKSENVTA